MLSCSSSSIARNSTQLVQNGDCSNLNIAPVPQRYNQCCLMQQQSTCFWQQIARGTLQSGLLSVKPCSRVSSISWHGVAQVGGRAGGVQGNHEFVPGAARRPRLQARRGRGRGPLQRHRWGSFTPSQGTVAYKSMQVDNETPLPEDETPLRAVWIGAPCRIRCDSVRVFP